MYVNFYRWKTQTKQYSSNCLVLYVIQSELSFKIVTHLQ